jgi:hypothetical protein
MIVAIIIFSILFVVFLIYLNRACGRDFEQEEEDARDKYYEKILKKKDQKSV